MVELLDVTRWQVRPWDSDFFGVRIAQIGGHRATASDLADALEAARLAGVACVYFLADADDRPTVAAAEANGFGLTDIRLTLECGVTAEAAAVPVPDVRPARAGDLPQLSALARVSHRNTRFHVDARFDADRADELYVVWIERSLRGELADAVHVVDVDGAARGYITMSAGERASSIGLVAVDAEYRGRGFGDRLLHSALHWTAERGLPRATVATQGRSAASVRFYERAGFTASLVQLWYHRWLS